MTPQKQTDRTLRKDAERNRERLMDAAREVFQEHGVEAPLEEIARRAGVGIGTLYRRFPTRESLIDAIFEAKAEEYVRASEEALASENAWEGFRRFLERICQMQAEDRGFADVLTATFPMAPAVEDRRLRAMTNADELIRRAQQEGTLRADFVLGDIVWILIANASFLQATREIAPDAWRRYLALILDALTADTASELPPPPQESQIKEAILRVSPPRGSQGL